MNNFASIILEQRKASLTPIEMLFLEDKNIILNKKGVLEERETYQPIDARIQYIYKILTNESIDRSSSNWQNIMNLKLARDIYIHRIGKETKKSPPIPDKKLIFKGFESIQNIVAEVFEKILNFLKNSYTSSYHFGLAKTINHSCGMEGVETPFI